MVMLAFLVGLMLGATLTALHLWMVYGDRIGTYRIGETLDDPSGWEHDGRLHTEPTGVRMDADWDERVARHLRQRGLPVVTMQEALELDEDGEAARLRVVLRELVELKDGPRDEDYRRRKEAAWQAARDLLSDDPDDAR